MSGIRFLSKGDFSNTDSFLKRMEKQNFFKELKKYGELGVHALSVATPVDTGKTAASWTYSIEKTARGATLSWHNTNLATEGNPIVIYLDYGHYNARTHSYTPGAHFIKKTINPVYKKVIEGVFSEIK